MQENLPLGDRLLAALFMPLMSFGFLLIFAFVGSSGMDDLWRHVQAMSERQWMFLGLLLLLLAGLGFTLGTFKAFRIHSYGAGGGVPAGGPISMGLARVIFFGATIGSVAVFLSGG